MQVTQNDLERAFNSSKLPQLGYTFEGAMSIHALAMCLKRMAENLDKPKPEPKATPKRTGVKTTYSRVKNYWYDNF